MDRCHLRVAKHSYFATTSTIDFSKTKWVSIWIENSRYGWRYGSIIGNVYFSEYLGISGEHLNIFGKIKLADSIGPEYGPQSKVAINAQNITISGENAEVQAGYTIMHAKDKLDISEGVKIVSLRPNACNTESHG